jgi:hypothetical protein
MNFLVFHGYINPNLPLTYTDQHGLNNILVQGCNVNPYIIQVSSSDFFNLQTPYLQCLGYMLWMMCGLLHTFASKEA